MNKLISTFIGNEALIVFSRSLFFRYFNFKGSWKQVLYIILFKDVHNFKIKKIEKTSKRPPIILLPLNRIIIFNNSLYIKTNETKSELLNINYLLCYDFMSL